MHQTILQEYIQGTTPNHYPRGSATAHSQEQTSWCQNIVTDLEMIMQPVFWAYMQEMQV